MKFNTSYFLLFIILLIIEIAIAVYIDSGFIRHTLGDVLVVILLYCFIKSLFPIKPIKAISCVFVFALSIEILQATSFLEATGLERFNLAKTVLGNTFSVLDIVAYAIGVIIVIFFEQRFNR